MLSVLLGFLVLFPRTFIQSSPDKALDVVRDYMALDRVKNRNTHYLIYKYYDEKGDTTLAKEELLLWESGFPEKELIKQAKMLRNAGQWNKAVSLLKRVIAVNPHYSDAWSNLAEAYMTFKKYDSAVYFCKIANGLNPNVSEILTNLGAAYMYLNKLDKAEKHFKKALKLDTTLYETPYNLAHVYYKQGKYDRYIEMLVKAGSKKNANWIVYNEIGQELARRGDFVRARKSFNMALARGMDSTRLVEIVKKYPRLLDNPKTQNSP